METVTRGNLLAIVTVWVTLIVGPVGGFTDEDFASLVIELGLPEVLASNQWEYTETSHICAWLIINP